MLYFSQRKLAIGHGVDLKPSEFVDPRIRPPSCHHQLSSTRPSSCTSQLHELPTTQTEFRLVFKHPGQAIELDIST
jgi:hypothetical protein